MLFFGGIVWSWVVFRAKHPAGFHAAAEHTNLLIGSINTALLVTSSFLFTRGVRAAERGRNDEVFRACVYTVALGLGFLVLKGIEWGLDFHEHLWPGPDFPSPAPPAMARSCSSSSTSSRLACTRRT